MSKQKGTSKSRDIAISRLAFYEKSLEKSFSLNILCCFSAEFKGLKYFAANDVLLFNLCA